MKHGSRVKIMEKISGEGQLMILGIFICVVAAIFVSFYLESPTLMIGIGMLAAFIIQKLRESREKRINESDNE
jgi:FtsH-binding integral membrane protein